MGRVLTQYRAGVTTDGLKHNKYRSPLLRARGACERKRRFATSTPAFDSPHRLDLSRDGHRESGPAHQTAVVREITVDPQTGKASGVRFIDNQTMKDYVVHAKGS